MISDFKTNLSVKMAKRESVLGATLPHAILATHTGVLSSPDTTVQLPAIVPGKAADEDFYQPCGKPGWSV